MMLIVVITWVALSFGLGIILHRAYDRTTGWSSAGDKKGKGAQARLGIPQA
jgi:hypothetical protein